ncbi:MAG TPA: MFS transporter [Puia sp.]|jgi:MFS family permease
MKSSFSLQQRVLLWLACSAIFFEAFDVSIVNLSLPLIATSLDTPLATAQWVQTLYLLSFGGFLLLGGRLCDYAGSRLIFLAGMGLFGAASALGYASHHFWSLLPARAGQGIGAALAMPAGISLLSRYFPAGEQQQTAFGIFGAFAAVGFAGGLALGGMVATLFDWHWIFGINIPVIALVLLAGGRFIPPETSRAGSAPNGWMAAWLTVTLVVFSYAIHEAAGLGWLVIPCLGLAIGSAVVLWRVDRRKARPFFGSGVYPDREAYRGLGGFILLGASFLPFVFTCTLSLYTLLNKSILVTGLILLPYSIGSALVSRYLLPVLFRRGSPRQVGILSISLLLGGDGLLMAGIGSHWEGWWLGALLLVNSISIAIGYPAFTVLSLTGVPPERQGIAAGIQSTLNTVGSGLGVSLIGLCLTAGATEGALFACCGIVGVLCVAALFVLTGGRDRRLPL